MNLFKYLNERVEIIFTDNDKLLGVVTHHTIAGDNDPEEESIAFTPEDGGLEGEDIEVFEHEIKSIKKV